MAASQSFEWAGCGAPGAGAAVSDSAAWLKATRAAKCTYDAEVLTLAGIFVQADDETKHFKIPAND